LGPVDSARAVHSCPPSGPPLLRTSGHPRSSLFDDRALDRHERTSLPPGSPAPKLGSNPSLRAAWNRCPFPFFFRGVGTIRGSSARPRPGAIFSPRMSPLPARRQPRDSWREAPKAFSMAAFTSELDPRRKARSRWISAALGLPVKPGPQGRDGASQFSNANQPLGGPTRRCSSFDE